MHIWLSKLTLAAHKADQSNHLLRFHPSKAFTKTVDTLHDGRREVSMQGFNSLNRKGNTADERRLEIHQMSLERVYMSRCRVVS